jgi:hypothetical protein
LNGLGVDIAEAMNFDELVYFCKDFFFRDEVVKDFT